MYEEVAMNEGQQAAGPGTRPTESSPGLAMPILVEWSVVRDDRIFGRVFHRARTEDGAMLTTSPVVQVRMVGPEQVPVAFTASGSAYLLGEPAKPYGEARARQFVLRKGGTDASASTDAGKRELQTAVLRLAG
jgi:hypothetical protein